MVDVKLDPDELFTLKFIHDNPNVPAKELRERGCTRIQALSYFGYIHHREKYYVVTKRGLDALERQAAR